MFTIEAPQPRGEIDMSASAADVLYVLNKLKDMIKKARTIKTVTLDNAEVRNFQMRKFTLDIEKLDLAMEFTPTGGAPIALTALHYFRSDKPDVITVNGDNVDDDKVEMDIDRHLLRADFEYKVEYVQSGAPHRLFMLARVDFF